MGIIHCVASSNHKPGKHVWDYRCKESMRHFQSVTKRRAFVKQQLLGILLNRRTFYNKRYQRDIKSLLITDKYVTMRRNETE